MSIGFFMLKYHLRMTLREEEGRGIYENVTMPVKFQTGERDILVSVMPCNLTNENFKNFAGSF